MVSPLLAYILFDDLISRRPVLIGVGEEIVIVAGSWSSSSLVPLPEVVSSPEKASQVLISGVLSMSVPPDAALISPRLITVHETDPLTMKVMLVVVDAPGRSVHESVLNAIPPVVVHPLSASVNHAGM
jgi:hypothetical protein